MTIQEQWGKIQTAYNEAHDKVESLAYLLRNKYRSEAFASQGELRKIETLRARRDRAYKRAFAWLDKHSPWDWNSGTSAHWIVSTLTAEQALSETAPLLPTESASWGVPHYPRRPRRKTC